MLSAQSQDGYWWGELEADTTLESDYILYLHILGEPDSPKIRQTCEIHPRSPAGRWRLEYFLRRSLGAERDRKGLGRAATGRRSTQIQRIFSGPRAKIHELGGLEATNSYTRFYLAMVGAIDWDFVPAIPPELMLLAGLVSNQFV